MAKKETFGDWLRRKRADVGLSQTELAERAGVSKQYISNLERNLRQPVSNEIVRPSMDVVDRLARALGVPLREARLAAGYAPPDAERIPQDFLQRVGVLFYGWEELSDEDKEDILTAIEVIAESAQRRRQRRRR